MASEALGPCALSGKAETVSGAGLLMLASCRMGVAPDSLGHPQRRDCGRRTRSLGVHEAEHHQGAVLGEVVSLPGQAALYSILC